MSWVWETELMPVYGDTNEWKEILHLKKAWVSSDGRIDHNYKISVAWITRRDKRKWALAFADNHEPRQFTTLKGAKAYAVATVILGA
jgi:hypothetical protein